MNGDKEDSCAFEMQKRAEADGSVMKRVLYVIQSLGGCNGADRSGIAVMDMLMKRNNIVCDVLELCPVTDTSIEVTGELFRLPKVADTGRFVDRGYINKMKTLSSNVSDKNRLVLPIYSSMAVSFFQTLLI